MVFYRKGRQNVCDCFYVQMFTGLALTASATHRSSYVIGTISIKSSIKLDTFEIRCIVALVS